MATTPIITIPHLRLSARKPGIPDDDETANWVLAEASGLVCDYARHPEWEDDADPEEAPRAARRIALAVATRVYKNPEFEKASSLGPISSSHHELWALGFNLADGEKEELEDLRSSSDGLGGLGIMTLAGGQVYDRTLYVGDSTGSDWLIPYFDTDDIEAGIEPDDVVVIP